MRRSRGDARGVERGDGRGEERRDARRPGGSSRGGGARALLRRRRRARRRGGGIEVAGIPRVHGVHGVGDWKITRHVVVSRETRRRRVDSIRGGRMGAGRSRPRPSIHPGDVLVAPTTFETRGGRGRFPRGSRRVGPRAVDLRVGETLGGRDRRVCRGRVTRRARGGEGRRANDAREPRGGGRRRRRPRRGTRTETRREVPGRRAGEPRTRFTRKVTVENGRGEGDCDIGGDVVEGGGDVVQVEDVDSDSGFDDARVRVRVGTRVGTRL